MKTILKGILGLFVFFIVLGIMGNMFDNDAKETKTVEAQVQTYQPSKTEIQDLVCIAKLSIARDGLIDSGHTYANSRALDKLTTLQDKLFVKYEIGHPHINTIKMDQVKKARDDWGFYYATDEEYGLASYSIIFDECGSNAGMQNKW